MSREWVGESDSDRTFLSARCPLSGVTEYGGGGDRGAYAMVDNGK